MGLFNKILKKKPKTAINTDKAIQVIYKNWEGKTSIRTIIPQTVYWGSNRWHPEPQWLLSAFDVEKGANRDFALSKCDFLSRIPGLE